ncbi:N-acetyl-gamma-glutamyl-phosphate reductase 1 [Kroppenstedtia guangzhouensis]|uniref:N-acetyl-gamma-glutamyl-phosphate reductase n=1 Tax=Kroppenstedtia guangzhouensis TaxID=1274356 RepID=A0ABQ1GHP4_9BACL|nr:N-acetyl-gamma-glutamyl-phosphate reductase [Kroppenstedtia guangzhouensis]GGA43743.1 N-acetyl-gamma-glutamyl-phosphate reductase 1 [Kroppenstedtia guangzhouensis]
MKRAAILGGTGFTGSELYRLLGGHPYIEVEYISSESKAGTPVDRYFISSRHKKNKSNLRFRKLSELDGRYDLIFSCLPTGSLPQHIERIAEHTDYIFNISGDYRIPDADLLQKYYPETLKHEFSGGSHYYIPEFSEIKRDVKVVNLPGCMAVASIYSLYPLVAHDLIESWVVTDAKTGSSGAGKSSAETHAERSHNFRPHKAHGHRHQPEIQFALQKHLGRRIELQFSTYSLDLPRGISVSSYSRLKEDVSEIDVKKAFYSTYVSKPFVHYLRSKNGAQSLPMIKTVVGTNDVEVGVYVEGRNCVSIASIDNLIKGAAGQAIQAANLYMGFPEETGVQSSAEGAWP